MKPTLEKINPGFGSSILVAKHEGRKMKNKASWHFHPEIELVYIHNGTGKKHIGNHLSYFNKSQLLMLGSDLPHHGFSDRLSHKGSETLVQFKPDFLGADFLKLPEMASLNSLFLMSKRGISFEGKTRARVGSKIQALVDLQGPSRILGLLDILVDLTYSNEFTLLNTDGIVFETSKQDSDKIDKLYKYINIHFERHIPLEEIADQANMTVPAFCRYFKKATGKTFTKLVNEYRIVHATKLLTESSMSVTDICYECGFNNFSHFNKQFKEVTGKSASKYRNELKIIT